jgi:hypothetical protein
VLHVEVSHNPKKKTKGNKYHEPKIFTVRIFKVGLEFLNGGKVRLAHSTREAEELIKNLLINVLALKEYTNLRYIILVCQFANIKLLKDAIV